MTGCKKYISEDIAPWMLSGMLSGMQSDKRFRVYKVIDGMYCIRRDKVESPGFYQLICRLSKYLTLL